MREVLALDTCALRDNTGVAVRVAGPTRLLTLGLSLMRQQVLAALSDSARKRIKRAIEAAPSAPAEFPEVDGGELGFSGTEGGLLMFERTPEILPASSLLVLGELLLRRYLALCPHALLGCRIAIHSEREGAALIDASGLSLRGELDRMQAGDATWSAIVGPSVGRRPPLRSFLLVHERVDEYATCAIVTRDVRPAIRAVQEGLRKVELREERTRALQSLATRLASATRAGLLSLRRTNEQLVAAGVLAVELGRRAGGATPPVIAPIEGQSYEALVGEPYDDSQGMVWLGVTKKAFSFIETSRHAMRTVTY